MSYRSSFLFVSSFVLLGVGCSGSEMSPPPSSADVGGGVSTGGQSGVVSNTGGRAAGATGGATTVSASGGAATVTGGAPNVATGGSVAATGGKASSTGGSSTVSATGGVATATGGAATATGGKTSSTGGGSTVSATGGAIATGGAATATGGKTATGGAATATGGKTATGGAATATGGKTATGGAAATGGATSTNTGCDIWVSTTGSDTADGRTEATAALTVAHGYDLLCPPPPSGSANGTVCVGTYKTLCIKPGTYVMNTRLEMKKTRMGTASRIITLQGDPNSATRPVLDFSSQPRVTCGANPSDGNLGGITINADYYAIKRLDIKGANDNCIKAQGAHGLVENVAAHACADAGIQIGTGSGYTGSGTYNTVLNCDSYDNVDPQCNGENADGFGAKESDGVGNVFRGCRAWNNTDDGWDFYGWSAPITVENCWAISQSKTNALSASDGNGFKLGGNSVSAAHILRDLYSTDNAYGSSGRGVTNNSNPASMTCAGTCASWSNKAADQGVSNVGTSAPSGATAAKMIAAARNADGSLPAITSL